MPAAPMSGAIDLESMLSVEEDARAELVARLDHVSTAEEEGSRPSVPSESAAK